MGLIGPETDGSTAIDGIVAVGSGHANQNAMSAAAAANAAQGLARGPPTLAIASLSIRAAADNHPAVSVPLAVLAFAAYFRNGRSWRIPSVPAPNRPPIPIQAGPMSGSNHR